MATIQHLQSSTQIIDLAGVKILTDPWLTSGEYYGSWFHQPIFDENEIETLEYDYIYVSHIHPDHLSEETFRKLGKNVPVLVPKFESAFLRRKVESYGFRVVELQHAQEYRFSAEASITIYHADNCNPELCGRFFGCKTDDPSTMSPNIDSLCVFKAGDYKILNTNDCPYDLAKEVINDYVGTGTIDLLLVGYAGAGPYPQCFDLPEAVMKRAVEQKKIQFLTYAKNYIELTNPKYFAPFAGTYILGGEFSHMNDQRGVPTVTDAIDWLNKNLDKRISSKSINFQQNDLFDLENEVFVKSQNVPKLLQPCSMTSDVFMSNNDKDIIELVNASYDRFLRVAKSISLKSETTVHIKSEEIQFYFSANTKVLFGAPSVAKNEPVLRMEVRHNLLLALLSGPRYAHWNNAEIGSHIRYKRTNVEFERDLGHALYFFHN